MITTKNSWLVEAKELFIVATPLIATLLSQYGMTIVDAIMMGRLGEVQFAAGALGEAVFFSVLLFCIGMLNAVGVFLSRHYGAKQEKEMSRILYHGFFLAVGLSIPGIFVLYFTGDFLTFLGLEKNLIAYAHAYLSAVAWTFPAAFCFVVLREFLATLSQAYMVMVISACAIPVNALANYILMYGKLGFPELGIRGIGFATAIVECLMLISLSIYIYRNTSLKRYFKSNIQFSFATLFSLIKLGLPIAVLAILEHGLFAVSAVMMGYFGVLSLAAHQIAFQAICVSFMFPLGISQASALLVSRALGAKNFVALRRFIYLQIGAGLSIAAIAATLFLFFPHLVVMIFIGKQTVANEALFNLAAHFLWIAVIFQFFDALQVICTGILRGFKDTVIPLIIGLFGYWLAGLGSGYVLAFVFKWSGVGLWWGLAIGIMSASLMLLCRVHYQLQGALK